MLFTAGPPPINAFAVASAVRDIEHAAAIDEEKKASLIAANIDEYLEQNAELLV